MMVLVVNKCVVGYSLYRGRSRGFGHVGFVGRCYKNSLLCPCAGG